MLRRVKKVNYLDGYRLKLQFDNEVIKIVDLEDMLKGAKNMFLQLLDLNYFRKVACDGYSICWPNGIDFCPDLLYRSGKNVTQKTKRKKVSRAVKMRKRSKAKV